MGSLGISVETIFHKLYFEVEPCSYLEKRTMRRIISGIILTMLSASILFSFQGLLVPVWMSTAESSTKIVIHPSERTEHTFYTNETFPGFTFIVNVTVVDVTELQNWQIELNWGQSVLEFSNIWRPSDHVFSGSGMAMVAPPPDIGPGYVAWGCTYINYLGWTFNGTGTLCQIQLKMLSTSSPPPITFNLTLTKLYDETFLLDGKGHDIQFTVEDGDYTLIALPDIAVTNITPERTIIGQGFSEILKINVTTLNEDYYLSTTSNLTVYVNSTILATTENITLAPRSFAIFVFIWNISGLAKGNYTITAVADVVQYETDTLDNTRNQLVVITIAGDVTSETGLPDSLVDMRDIGAICNKFGTRPSNPNWDPNMDVNADGVVNMRDIGIACNNFMKT